MFTKYSSYNYKIYSLIATLIILIFLRTKEIDFVKVNSGLSIT